MWINYDRFNPRARKSLFLAALIVLTVLSSGSAGQSIRIGGTGGALGVMKLLAKEFQRIHPAIAVVVLPSMGSRGGIEAVRAGAIDIGLSSTAVTGAEQSIAGHAYGRTPFVFAVSEKTRVSGLTTREIIDIYSGKTVAWQSGERIRPVLRPPSEYDLTLLKSMSEEMDEAVRTALSREGMILEVTDQESATSIEKVPGAVGTTTLAQIISEKRRLKALSLDGAEPTAENLARGAYPYSKTYYLVISKSPDSAVRKFIGFVYSKRGQDILVRSGYLPTGP